jgi:predicted MFS family arabinose efflux permease
MVVTVADIGTGGSVVLLAPALLLIGTGMGIVIAPLVTLILSNTGPEQAGPASGVLSTIQNVGNALGVAIVGVIYFGAAHSGLAGAFQLSLAALAAILVGVAAVTKLLPAPAGAPSGGAT